MADDRGPRLRQRRLALFLVAASLASVWVGALWFTAHEQRPIVRGAFVTDYDGRVLDDGLEILLVQGDGQAFATLARDPLLRRPESFTGPGEAAYRAQRPLLPYLVWAGSFGQTGWVPPALAISGVLGTASAVIAAGALIAERGRSQWWGLALLLFPGVPATLEHFGPEPLVVALLLWGLLAWERDRTRPAVLLFMLAVLGRETAILVPLVLGLHSLATRRWNRAAALLPVPLALAAWWALLRVRVGSWPTEAGGGRLGLPLRGLVDAADTVWGTAGEPHELYLAVTVLLVVAAVAVAPRSLYTMIVLAHAAFATTMGVRVWVDVEFYSRVLLPMYAIALVVIAREFGRTGDESPPPPMTVGNTTAVDSVG